MRTAEEHADKLMKSLMARSTWQLAEQLEWAEQQVKWAQESVMRAQESVIIALQARNLALSHRQRLKDNRKRGGAKKEAETAAMDSETFLGCFCCAVAAFAIIIVAVITGLTFFGKAGPQKGAD